MGITASFFLIICQLRFQAYDFLGAFIQITLQAFHGFLRVFQLDLGSDQFMLQIIKFLFLSLDIFLKQRYLLPGLEIIIRNVQLKQNALPFNRLFPEAVQLAVFRHFIIDVGSDLLQVFLTLVTAQSKDLPA